MSAARVRSALRMVRTTQKVKMADGRGEPVCTAVSLGWGSLSTCLPIAYVDAEATWPTIHQCQ